MWSFYVTTKHFRRKDLPNYNFEIGISCIINVLKYMHQHMASRGPWPLNSEQDKIGFRNKPLFLWGFVENIIVCSIVYRGSVVTSGTCSFIEWYLCRCWDRNHVKNYVGTMWYIGLWPIGELRPSRTLACSILESLELKPFSTPVRTLSLCFSWYL